MRYLAINKEPEPRIITSHGPPLRLRSPVFRLLHILNSRLSQNGHIDPMWVPGIVQSIGLDKRYEVKPHQRAMIVSPGSDLYIDFMYRPSSVTEAQFILLPNTDCVAIVFIMHEFVEREDLRRHLGDSNRTGVLQLSKP